MSRIWDSLKDLERRQPPRKTPQEALRLFERRCGERVRICLPIFVYGHTIDREPFYEGTELLFANAMGGLVTLRSAVAPGQKLLLTNRADEREVECLVLGLRSGYLNRFAIAIVFGTPSTNFWARTKA